MKSFNKAIRLIRLVLIIFLASPGIGLTGCMPAPFSRKRENEPPFKIELPGRKDGATELKQADFKQEH